MSTDPEDRPVDQYIDVRELTEGYEEDICAYCGEIQWFKVSQTWDELRCTECSRERREDVEYPCSKCGTRMYAEKDEWVCRYCGETDPLDRDGLVQRMTGSHDVTGYNRGSFRKCPLCSESRAVRVDPDGELICMECEELYLGQYSAGWFAYAVWLKNPDRIRHRLVVE